MTTEANATKSGRLRSRPFRFDLLLLLVGLVLITGFAIVAYSYHANSRAALSVSSSLVDQSAATAIEKTTQYLLPAKTITSLTSNLLTVTTLDIVKDREVEAYLLNVLISIPQIAMVYIGNEQGNFIKAERLPGGGYTTQSIDLSGSTPKVVVRRRDAQGVKVSEEESAKVEYDPRTRPWYQSGKVAGRDGCWTDIYRFFTGGRLGITASAPAFDKEGKVRAVCGADITLDALSEFLGTLSIGKNGVVVIADGKHQVVASSWRRAPDMACDSAVDMSVPERIDQIMDMAVSSAFRERQLSRKDRFSVVADGQRHLAHFRPFPKPFGTQWEVAIVVPEDDFIGELKRTNLVALLISVVVLAIGVICAFLLSRGLSRPIQLLTAEMRRIRGFDLEGKVEVDSHIREIQDMSSALAAMKSGLAAFRKYVPADLVRLLIERGEEARLGGSRQEITLLFTDIAGFTTIAEKASPEAMATQLSEYLDAVAGIIAEEGGTLDKYMGDGVMAFWGAPLACDDQASRACRAACRCRARISEMNQAWAAAGKPVFYTRMGLNTGECVVGNIGSRDRMNYTAVGDSVNLASRLEGANRLYGSSIIVSHSTCRKAGDGFLFRPLDAVAVKGKIEPVMIYELLGLREMMPASVVEDCGIYLSAMEAYRRRDWAVAIGLLKALAAKNPGDGTVSFYLARCEELSRHPEEPEGPSVLPLDFK